MKGVSTIRDSASFSTCTCTRTSATAITITHTTSNIRLPESPSLSVGDLHFLPQSKAQRKKSKGLMDLKPEFRAHRVPVVSFGNLEFEPKKITVDYKRKKRDHHSDD